MYLKGKSEKLTSYVTDSFNLLLGECPIDIHKDYHLRIEKLESLVKPFESPELYKRIERLETTNRIWFEDPEMIKRLEAVEQLIEHTQEGIGKCFELIEKLEASGFPDMKNELICFKQQRNELLKRIRELERIIAEHSKTLCPDNIAPFKCPVCEGTGGVKHPLTGLLAPATCHACEGVGIVWG